MWENTQHESVACYFRLSWKSVQLSLLYTKNTFDAEAELAKGRITQSCVQFQLILSRRPSILNNYVVNRPGQIVVISKLLRASPKRSMCVCDRLMAWLRNLYLRSTAPRHAVVARITRKSLPAAINSLHSCTSPSENLLFVIAADQYSGCVLHPTNNFRLADRFMAAANLGEFTPMQQFIHAQLNNSVRH